ncbi:porin [Pigmentiphaga soli]|uniref:Porin n=1 Tax=Pigmentiphaga soli TaxID=1007095 RepID=A0ABP8HGK8_9BURK
MKKTLLAAALLAGFAGAAQAQSSVTLYGVVDGGFNYRKTDGNSTKGIDSGLLGQSRFGFRGQEDLGSGLKAIFLLESGFNSDDGGLATYGNASTKIFGRAAYVGLESATAGRLTFGRQTNMQFTWAGPIVNPFGLSWSTAQIGSTFSYNDAEFGGNSSRIDNSVYYYSPSFSGVQAAVGYSFAANSETTGNERAGTSNNDRLIDVGLKYEGGPLKAVATYQYLNPTDTIANNGKPQAFTVGANYDFGVVAVYAGYNKTKNIRNGSYNGSAGFATPTRNDDNAYTVGVSAPVGPGKVLAAYQRATKSDVKLWSVGYLYGLSKRTDLYAFYADADKHNFTLDHDYSDRQFALGIQHRF